MLYSGIFVWFTGWTLSWTPSDWYIRASRPSEWQMDQEPLHWMLNWLSWDLLHMKNAQHYLCVIHNRAIHEDSSVEYEARSYINQRWSKIHAREELLVLYLVPKMRSKWALTEQEKGGYLTLNYNWVETLPWTLSFCLFVLYMTSYLQITQDSRELKQIGIYMWKRWDDLCNSNSSIIQSLLLPKIHQKINHLLIS